MLRDPPLVENATATSSGRACAMSCRRKMTSMPTSLATAVTRGRLERERDGGHRPIALRRADAIDRPVVGVGGRAAVAEHDQLAAARQARPDLRPQPLRSRRPDRAPPARAMPHRRPLSSGSMRRPRAWPRWQTARRVRGTDRGSPLRRRHAPARDARRRRAPSPTACGTASRGFPGG